MPYRSSSIDHHKTAEDDATSQLRRLVYQRATINQRIDAEVDRLESGGLSWPVIARALGVTRQAARQRHERRQHRSR